MHQFVIPNFDKSKKKQSWINLTIDHVCYQKFQIFYRGVYIGKKKLPIVKNC